MCICCVNIKQISDLEKVMDGVVPIGMAEGNFCGSGHRTFKTSCAPWAAGGGGTGIQSRLLLTGREGSDVP